MALINQSVSLSIILELHPYVIYTSYDYDDNANDVSPLSSDLSCYLSQLLAPLLSFCGL